jgi:hypothetical protein
MLPCRMFISNSIDSCVEENDNATYTAEVLNNVNVSDIPPPVYNRFKTWYMHHLIKNLNISMVTAMGLDI